MKLGRSVAPAAAMAWDFVAVGEGGVDLLCQCREFPTPDRKEHLRHLTRLPGGQTATAAVGCARLGWRSRWVGAIGDDPAGQELCAALTRERVDVRAVVKSGVATRTAVVIVADDTEGRAVLELRDPRLDIAPRELPPESFAGRVVLVDATDVALARRAATHAKATGGRLLIDIDSASAEGAGTRELLALIDVVIVPAEFVTTFSGRRSLGAALADMGRALPEAAAVVATMGAEGALAWCRGTEVPVPPHAVDVVDPTGAGDAFRAGFAHGWLASAATDPELEHLLDVASRVAALNCRTLGAQTGLPTRAELSR